MNFSKQLTDKAQWNSVKYTLVSISGRVASCDNKKEVSETIKFFGEPTIALTRQGVVAISQDGVKVTNLGTKKFDTLLSTITISE